MENQRIVQSPSGKYTLGITSLETRPGSWSYTLGIVSMHYKRQVGPKVEDAVLVIDQVKRNYSSFPYLFIEGHPNGHDYLVCGADYQGQTVIELDTGKRRDFLPPEAAQGHGFCWADYEFNADHQLLIVDGCVWACPYEYRFYDFRNPMVDGWRQIEVGGRNDYISADDGKKPELTAWGILTVFETRSKGDIANKPYLEHTAEDEERVVVATRTFQLTDDRRFLPVLQWVDEEEQKRREANKAAREEYERKWTEYKATNPLFLRVMDRGTKKPFKHEDYSLSTGVCHDSWHPTEKFDDGRVCKRLLDKPRHPNGRQMDKGWTVDLEWGRNFAPVKLQIFKDGKYFNIDKRCLAETDDEGRKESVKFFPHSVEGIDQALDLAIKLMED